MLMNVCLQAYQRFQHTLGKEKLDQCKSWRLSKIASMRSMRNVFDNAAEHGISRANTTSSADFATPAVGFRKEAKIIQASRKSMTDLLEHSTDGQLT